MLRPAPTPRDDARPCFFTQGDVHIIDKSGEEYVPPPAKPFDGEGRTMRDESAAAAAPAVAGAELVVDAGQPTTTLQIRLADGTCSGMVKMPLARSSPAALPPLQRPGRLLRADL